MEVFPTGDRQWGQLAARQFDRFVHLGLRQLRERRDGIDVRAFLTNNHGTVSVYPLNPTQPGNFPTKL
jgi:hypothetical protein